MYVCICARVRECELRSAIRAGARTKDAVGAACGAGTGCGTCLGRVGDLIIDEELLGVARAAPGLAPATR
ncbi:MAG: (2Fe-2S)-binding protein [Natronosporangium sp.]